MSLVSVIVPVFQVEMYLNKCLDSILNQTYDQMEIILVDDGSTDRSGQICEEYAQKDDRVQVIHQQNKGLSGARNTGIQRASGEYLVFIDSDDWIETDYIKKMMSAAKDQDCSLVICNYKNVTSENERIEKGDGTDAASLEPNTIESDAMVNENIDFTTAEPLVLEGNALLLAMYEPFAIPLGFSPTAITVSWNKLYKASLWEDLSFPEGRIHEDEATTYRILDMAKKACFLKEPLYCYRQTPGSITNLKFSIKRLDWMLALEERILYFKNHKNDQMVLESMKAYADTSIHFYYEMKKLEDSNRARKLKEQVRDVLLQHKKYGTLPLRTRIGYCLFLLNTSMFHYLNYLNGGDKK